MDNYQRMIDTQAKLISKLNDRIRKLEDSREKILSHAIQNYNNVKKIAYYDAIMNSCAEDENVAAAFSDFMVMLNLYKSEESFMSDYNAHMNKLIEEINKFKDL